MEGAPSALDCRVALQPSATLLAQGSGLCLLHLSQGTASILGRKPHSEKTKDRTKCLQDSVRTGKYVMLGF